MSVGVGSSAGKGKGTQSSAAATQLQQMASNLLGEQAGLRSTLTSTLKDLISGGGVTEATTLDPTSAQEKAKYEASKSIADIKRDLDKSGLSGTPYGAGIVAQAKTERGQQAAELGAQYELESKTRQQNLFQTLLSLASGYVTGQTGSVASGLGAAVPGNVKSKGASTGVSAGGLGSLLALA